MNTQDARTLFGDDQWANRRLLAVARVLSPEDWGRDLRASFSSVQGTLVHILAGEWKWLRFWRGDPSVPVPTPEDCPDAVALEADWAALEQEQLAFAARLTDELLEGRQTVRGHRYCLAEMVQHVVNHSTYHRGQVALLLRQLGHRPPPTDFAVFLAEAGESELPNG